jgi:aryl-alcohol dehydrogenase-like predicted oxidoreductase
MLATPEGTQRFRARFPHLPAAHWRTLRGAAVGSIGLGSYLGRDDAQGDAGYEAAVRAALRLGGNLLDTAINYRGQRSERAIGAALQASFAAGEAQRDEVVVCTKGGYLPVRSARELEEQYLRPGVLAAEDIVDGCHAMTPRYLRDQLARSLRNLRLDAVDVYYVHNPEHALPELGRAAWEARVRDAFRALEEACDAGQVGCYGVATWNGLRADAKQPEHIGLERLVALAKEAGGAKHRFAVVQLPLNLAMTEALLQPTQEVRGAALPALDAARELGIAVVGSASLLQGRLSRGLPPFVDAVLQQGDDARNALQFARSCPGVTASLVGMGRAAHAEADLALARSPPASGEDVRRLLEAARR